MSSVGDEMGVGSKRSDWLAPPWTRCLGQGILENIWGVHICVSTYGFGIICQVFLTSSRLGCMYGAHLHKLVQMRSARRQSTGTFFFRNRPEIELLIRLLDRVEAPAVDLAILGCSKGAEVYSFSYSIRSARPELEVRIRAVDIDADVVEFAEGGVYYLKKSRWGTRSRTVDSLFAAGRLGCENFRRPEHVGF